MRLGAGRLKLDDKINHRVGILLNKKSGDYVKEGDILAYIHSVKEDNLEIEEMIKKAYLIDESKYSPRLILDVIK